MAKNGFWTRMVKRVQMDPKRSKAVTWEDGNGRNSFNPTCHMWENYASAIDSQIKDMVPFKVMAILWKILWFAKTPWSITTLATTKNLLWMSQCVLNWCHCRTETVSWNQIAGIPLDNTYMLLSRRIFQNHILINVTVLFILTSEAIAQILYLWLGCLNLGVGIPPCVIKALITYMYSFQPDVAFEENISKSYSYQCHSLY